jgi:2-polyprenyl-6-methoxyphenol hydroxylase-like FAD-dependent oxidoreductase
MHLPDLHVAVVGAGTGGSATALLLARAGARVDLIERVEQPRAVGAGIALAENGLAVLESLGLGPALGTARQLRGVRITDAAGRALLEPPEPAPRVVMLRRSTLQEVLLDAIASESRITAHFGAAVLRATSDGEVTIGCVNGGTTAARSLRADLVIAADGVHSAVRSGGDFGARVRRTGIEYARALVAGDVAAGCEAWTPAGVFGSFPVENGTYVYASCGTPECRAAIAARDLDAFRAAWARAYGPAARILAAVPQWDALLFNEVVRVDCARWMDGRLALLGDAAHAMAPNLGQGANSALVDAGVLLDELRRAPGMSAALAAYDRRRRPAVRRVADTSGRLGRLAELTHPAARWLRDRLLLPAARRLTTERTTAAVLQESPRTLLAIGRP